MAQNDDLFVDGELQNDDKKKKKSFKKQLDNMRKQADLNLSNFQQQETNTMGEQGD